MRCLARLTITLLLATIAGAAFQTNDVLVFAASSLQNALDELKGPVERATGARIKASYAASSALARQGMSHAMVNGFVYAPGSSINAS